MNKLKPAKKYWNQTYAIVMINEKIKVSPSSFYEYEGKGFFGPDGVLMHGKREMPGYSDEKIAEIIHIITEYKVLGRIPPKNG